MEFRIDCPCGSRHSVNEGSAGATLACNCGRAITVPSLSALRVQAGLPPYDPGPVLVIQHMLAAGKLPGTKMCTVCGHETEHVLNVLTECEKSYRSDAGKPLWIIEFLFLLIAPLLYVFVRRREEVQEYGRETSFVLPLPVCNDCRPTIGNSKVLRQSMEKIPEYSRLFQKFPKSQLVLQTPNS
jgi:hypothetical protein